MARSKTVAPSPVEQDNVGEVVIISGDKFPLTPDLLAVKAEYDRLTQKQRAWFDHFIKNRNQTLSAELAGYSGGKNTLAKTGSANREKMQHMIDVIDNNAKEVVQAITEITGLYNFWGTTLADGTQSMRDRLKASELLARALGAFDNENSDTNIFINTDKYDEIDQETLEAFIITNTGNQNGQIIEHED